MHAIRVPGPVLVVFDAYQGRLGRSIETGDDEGPRIGLLEVVERTVGHIFAQLPQLAAVPQMVRHPVTVDRLDEQRVRGDIRAGRDVAR